MLKLILADNQAIFRAGIAKVLAVEDEMRIVAQAQTPEQMFMALDKFRAAVLVVAAGFHNDFAAIVQGANKAKTRVVVLADTGESAQRHMANGAHGVVYRNVTSAALGRLRSESGARRDLGAGCRGAERIDGKRYGWVARTRPVDSEGTAHCGADCAGI